jgi:hypothetical protein
VDGTKIPDVSWDAGASYAGLLPISNKTGENRKLYFWFFPPGPQGSTDDLVMYALYPFSPSLPSLTPCAQLAERRAGLLLARGPPAGERADLVAVRAGRADAEPVQLDEPVERALD